MFCCCLFISIIRFFSSRLLSGRFIGVIEPGVVAVVVALCVCVCFFDLISWFALFHSLVTFNISAFSKHHCSASVKKRQNAHTYQWHFVFEKRCHYKRVWVFIVGVAADAAVAAAAQMRAVLVLDLCVLCRIRP